MYHRMKVDETPLLVGEVERGESSLDSRLQIDALRNSPSTFITATIITVTIFIRKSTIHIASLPAALALTLALTPSCRMFSRMDPDDSGYVDLEEFEAYMREQRMALGEARIRQLYHTIKVSTEVLGPWAKYRYFKQKCGHLLEAMCHLDNIFKEPSTQQQYSHNLSLIAHTYIFVTI